MSDAKPMVLIVDGEELEFDDHDALLTYVTNLVIRNMAMDELELTVINGKLTFNHLQPVSRIYA